MSTPLSSREATYIHGHMLVSEQMLREIQRQKCQEASDDRYAVTGVRSGCACGQHESPVPLAPVFDRDGHS